MLYAANPPSRTSSSISAPIKVWIIDSPNFCTTAQGSVAPVPLSYCTRMLTASWSVTPMKTPHLPSLRSSTAAA